KHNNIVFSDPYVRSLSINDHGIVTCSSVSGNTPIVVPNWQSEHHSIRFFTLNLRLLKTNCCIRKKVLLLSNCLTYRSTTT
ncbi:hypothetical protein, partial [Vibrio viridaestus]|uniref:hypothetical protein n=1 Tax=Vibrio viridaestus TaxID=2487322 RepID=UPI001AA086F5